MVRLCSRFNDEYIFLSQLGKKKCPLNNISQTLNPGNANFSILTDLQNSKIILRKVRFPCN